MILLAYKRNEINDKVTEYYHSLSMTENLFKEGILTAVIPGPPEIAAYEITEFIIPELMDEIGNAMSLTGQIDMALSEYDSLFRQKDIVSEDHIAQSKLR